MKNIPFFKQLFLRCLIGVLAALVLTFAVSVLFFEYEMTTADVFCSPIAALLAAYFIHLMLVNPDSEEGT